jgi:hypothetical protein
LAEVLNEYSIAHLVGYFVMDGATNNDKAIRLLSQFNENVENLWVPEERRVRCLGHIISLSAKDLLNSLDAISSSDADGDGDVDAGSDSDSDSDVDDLVPHAATPGPIAKLHFIVYFIRRSPLRRAVYRAVADDLHVPDRMLVSNNETRFNSTCRMIRTALPAQLAIDQFAWEEQLSHYNDTKTSDRLRKNVLTPQDWRDLETMCRILRPFEGNTVATEGMSFFSS